MLSRLIAEPPFRLLAREWVRRFSSNPRTLSRWGAAPYPTYLTGVLYGAHVAKVSGVDAFTAIEFGVASGNGLVALEKHAKAVTQHTGIKIQVYGFDAGSGLPEVKPDYRDHSDYWRSGDFPMDVPALKKRLDPSVTTLVIGPIAQTLANVQFEYPVGFVSFDVDLYTSTTDALTVFARPERKLLRRVPCYFDDMCNEVSHHRAGERLAIHEFNARHWPDDPGVVIDEWHDVTTDKPFPEAPMWKRLRLAHDLREIERYAAEKRRDVRVM